MDWERVRQQLEQIVGTPVKREKLPWADWQREAERALAEKGEEQGAAKVRSVLHNGEQVFLLGKDGQDAVTLRMQTDALTEAERQLVELMIEVRRGQEKKSPGSGSEEERKAIALRDWIRQQQDLGYRTAETPDALISSLSLYSKKIPLLLYGDYSPARKVHYSELKKLLESFFDAEITLIPLNDKEWLILGPEKMLAMDASDDKDTDDEERVEDKLSAIGYGLHEMLETEWVGESHLAIHYPIIPAKELYETVLQLRETIMLGRTYHIGSNMHLPWTLQLEKLIHGIPEQEKTEFLERVLKRFDVALDMETMTTLEQFFQLDCNVSETAKKLYIHRNTLLYRLDKFKQETGLDVRTFNDAVLVKISMLLYKVTKRK